MNIAIIANDKKKELITEFCIAYCGILSRHNICSTAITGKYISEATGLQIEKMLSGSHGGIEQIASKIAYDEVDILTNVATAEVLVLALDRGDLDWRANIRNGAKAF